MTVSLKSSLTETQHTFVLSSTPGRQLVCAQSTDAEVIQKFRSIASVLISKSMQHGYFSKEACWGMWFQFYVQCHKYDKLEQDIYCKVHIMSLYIFHFFLFFSCSFFFVGMLCFVCIENIGIEVMQGFRLKLVEAYIVVLSFSSSYSVF